MYYRKISTTGNTHYKPHPRIWAQYAYKILVPIDKPHRYSTNIVRTVSGTSRIVICQTLLL